jgi:hypothetical protein
MKHIENTLPSPVTSLAIFFLQTLTSPKAP